MTTKVPVELSSTPGIVDGSNATAITIDSSENSTFAGNITIPADGTIASASGDITLDAPDDIFLDADGGNIRFKDAGIGIPSSEINNIFKKFYRIQNRYNQNGSVGLGLAFCKELVNFMNGEISVKSVVDKGTEFKIVLPYNN